MMSMDRVYHLPNEQESLTTATNGTDGEVDDFSFTFDFNSECAYW